MTEPPHQLGESRAGLGGVNRPGKSGDPGADQFASLHLGYGELQAPARPPGAFFLMNVGGQHARYIGPCPVLR